MIGWGKQQNKKKSFPPSFLIYIYIHTFTYTAITFRSSIVLLRTNNITATLKILRDEFVQLWPFQTKRLRAVSSTEGGKGRGTRRARGIFISQNKVLLKSSTTSNKLQSSTYTKIGTEIHLTPQTRVFILFYFFFFLCIIFNFVHL